MIYTRIYDCEVYAHDWLVVIKTPYNAKDIIPASYEIIWNDNEALKNALEKDLWYFGFNSKWYDQYIIKGIVAGFTPEELKALNDWIIQGKQGWEFPGLQGVYFDFNNIDLRDDMQNTLSLKSIEGHLGMDIKETEVDFNLDRPLTQEEKVLVTKYCKHDVDATEKLLDIRSDYIMTKANLGERAGIERVDAVRLTNAKLTAKMLNAKRVNRNDGREYVYPDNLDKNYVPKEVLEFFDNIRDLSIPDEELFQMSLETEIGGMPVKYGWGGVHGSVKGYFFQSTEKRKVQNRDVSSLYPTLLEKYGYLSRNVPDPELFYQIRKDRIQAKHEGIKQLAKDLKLPLNTVSGAQENKYNDLYDPLPTRSLRITGQLSLTVLLMRLLEKVKSFTPINFNTDGLMYEVDTEDIELVDKICKEWETESRFELETDDIEKVWIKDVNNLLLVKTNGEVKTVGGYLNYGISEKGAWGINNNYIIVKKALREYMVNGTPLEETINNSNDPKDFQIIAHASSKYKGVFQKQYGIESTCQKTNRVYATKDKQRGTLYKVKAEGQIAKMPGLPAHCLIDNDNHYSEMYSDINYFIDKDWYIQLANKMLNDFKGEREMPKKKEDVIEVNTNMNVYEKLMNVRMEFAANGIKKSGKNMKMQYTYFELEDIVPVVTPLFAKYRLFPMPNFTSEYASLGIINMDNTDDVIIFTIPMKEIAPTLSKNTGTEITNEVQRLGMTITYSRRYLYMIALDIVEQDQMEFNTDLEKPAISETPEVKKAPATTKERAEIKEELTSGSATDLQIKQLKKSLKKLIEKFPDKEEIVSKIAIETNNFTEMSKEDCEATIQGIAQMLGE